MENFDIIKTNTFLQGDSVTKKTIIKVVLSFSAIIALAGFVMGTMSSEASKTVTAESGYAGQTTSEFIASIGESARQIAQENDLYASVMIAQAILESSNGQSALSQAPHYNYFGIKGSYNGNSVTMLTWEDDGFGNTYEIDEPFRSYGYISGSLYDYANLLRTSTYSGTWKSNTTSYTDAKAALTGLYATDTAYAYKLNSIIDIYGLTAYDSPAYGAEQGATTTGDYVWNSHRGAYTDSATLAEDEAWLAHIGLSLN